MRLLVFVAFVATLRQPAEGMLSTDTLCGVIVDTWAVENCLQCFLDAGSIMENPDGYRECVASYLPPMVADCSVPHHEQSRINQKPPGIHPNHTNANLLPNCLRRRMRNLQTYLAKEKVFAKQAGKIVKAIALSNLVVDGGPAMLGIEAQEAIMEETDFKQLVQVAASECIGMYSVEEGARMLGVEGGEEVQDTDEEGGQEWMSLRGKPNEGNGLPFGGTGELAAKVMEGECVINKLLEEGYGVQIIRIVTRDEFMYPVPQWWVPPLLAYYKDFREQLESGHYQ